MRTLLKQRDRAAPFIRHASNLDHAGTFLIKMSLGEDEQTLSTEAQYFVNIFTAKKHAKDISSQPPLICRADIEIALTTVPWKHSESPRLRTAFVGATIAQVC
jgi:hypothetical protein